MEKEQILRAIAHILDEESGKPLVQIGLIRDILVTGNHVALTLLLHTEDVLKQTYMRNEIIEALNKAAVSGIHVRIKIIPKDEWDKIVSNRLAPRPLSKASSEALSPILSPESGVQFIAVASGKGGVGKSTVTVNLALALQRSGKRVGIIDADVYGFSIPDMLGMDKVSLTNKSRIVPVEFMGLQLISTDFFVPDNNPVVWRGPMLGKMLSTFLNEVAWSPMDYMLIDLPPGTGDIALHVHQKIPHCAEIIVTTPHTAASHVAARAGAMAKQLKHRILGVVENMSYFQDADQGKKHYLFGRMGGIQLAEELQTKLLAQIPMISVEADASEPADSPSVFHPDTRNGAIFTDLAKQIMQQLSDSESDSASASNSASGQINN
ncbi:Mrp/NBP35 family ATP-binding protein [Paenibacillus eucommiae]|uniref:Iron-sulfur cluster carrier protein n=1 Tax=Paenibacillus eucommiae TaxID=1355755 RepID=A0ABS4IQT1_9BACL|nr:Mrp/NBP35 family ATP-binding protein [Paenibacillus eucommiae]MBP1989919.1 ATP-binding protein involved in chromosome partitioning [Paenibacillus eucommiae]